MPGALPAPDRGQLRRYLVGLLSDEETERLDELSVADDRVALELREAENDLVDAYVRGELSGETLERFHSHYATAPGRVRKIQLARALLANERRTPHPAWRQESAVATPAVAPTLARRRLSWPLAAAAVLALAAAGYLLVDNARLRRQFADREQQLARELTDARARNSETAAALERARQSLADRALSNAASGVFAVTLRPATRGADDTATVAAPTAVAAVTIRLELETDDFPEYEAVLKDPATGQSLWRSSRTPSSSLAATKAVIITVPHVLLSRRHYAIELFGIRPSAAATFVTSYAFRVIAP